MIWQKSWKLNPSESIRWKKRKQILNAQCACLYEVRADITKSTQNEQDIVDKHDKDVSTTEIVTQ